MPPSVDRDTPPPYAELHCLSNFTFLRGASHPAELVQRAHRLGYAALAITDECSLAGAVRAHVAARTCGLPLILGSEFHLADGLRLVLLASDRQAYAGLCALISVARQAAPKGQYRATRADVARYASHCLALWLPGEHPDEDDAAWFRAHFPARAWLAVELHAAGNDRARLVQLLHAARAGGLPAVATGDVHMHVRGRRALQDVLGAIRRGIPLTQSPAGSHANGERHLRPREALAARYPAALLAATLEVAARVCFSLDELRCPHPCNTVPPGETADGFLRRRVDEGLQQRWPGGPPPEVVGLVARELALIAELDYAAYFLTVDDIVQFARRRGILCQGRGSAANSAVCYCLGITEVDPARLSLLFERFISRERNEPPDIDVDFEHERREEVIQYIYARHGRRRAALVAAVIRYRRRSAVRDVAKALGFGPVQAARLSRLAGRRDGPLLCPERLRAAGFDPGEPRLHRLAVLAAALDGFPRHLSQHVGGFLVSDEALDHVVPLENAAMPGRTVICWDKDDIEALGFLKIDVLALGMLSAIRRALDLIGAYSGRTLELRAIPAEDPAVYDMVSRGDTMGVFQIESRAQMAMLPRLRPRCFYDLVIQVAIVRPGPIQGEMVHPYLKRRNGEEAVSYPGEAVRHVLARTLGVPLFQEQVMQLAVVAAGFTPGEADELRRAMAAWRRRGDLDGFGTRLIEGMRARGYTAGFATQVYNQIRGFGEYGFPESHAASFALLAYASAWLKCHEPAAFTAALLNSQPMGFYAPAQLVGMARRHGVEVRPVDVNHSGHDCTLEGDPPQPPALRLGLRLVSGLTAQAAAALLGARDRGGAFASVVDLEARVRMTRGDLAALADAGALAAIAGNRHQARWRVAAHEGSLPLWPAPGIEEGTPLLRRPAESQEILADYRRLGLTLGRHPLALLRDRFDRLGMVTAAELQHCVIRRPVRLAGLVINRQQPGSARGTVFVTLEDESGHANLILRRHVAVGQRRVLVESMLMGVWGRLQRRDGVTHVIVSRMEDLGALLGGLTTASRDFR